MARTTPFGALAGLLRYPDESWRQRLDACESRLRSEAPALVPLFEDFRGRVAGLSAEAMQELFTRTFDLNPVCTPEVGWHLFGEQYERGEFLVKMRGLMRHFEIPEDTELPDHLTHVLEVLGEMEPEGAQEFAAACVFPALDKMSASFRDDGSAYESVLRLVVQCVEGRYERGEAPAPQPPELHVIQGGGPA